MGVFGLSVTKDIVAASGDGASVMTCFGAINDFEYVQCLNHAINIAVNRVMYEQVPSSDVVETSDSDTDSEEENYVSDNEDDTDDVDDDESEDEYITSCESNLKHDFKLTISRMRKIAKMFRKSPKKDEILRQYTKEHLKANIGLILDSKTRWNSLHQAIERFLRLSESVEATLKHKSINKTTMWSNADTLALRVSFDYLNQSAQFSDVIVVLRSS